MNVAVVSRCPALIAIGISAGGPGTVVKILRGLPLSHESAVIVLQHFNEKMTSELLDWLSRSSGREIRVPVNGESIRSGVIYLASSDGDIELNGAGIFRCKKGDFSSPYAPSIDRFFLSLASYPAPILGVVMTGMGEDGAKGLLCLRKAGQETIAQDEASAIVSGMPRAAVRMGAAGKVLNPEGIIEAIKRFDFRSGRRAI